MCTAKSRPQWCRITLCEKCPFYNARKEDKKMTQEEKQLLSIDLCARLPYGVKASSGHDILTLSPRTDVIYVIDNGFIPYLRPMSSMTKEEWRKFSVFIGKTETYVQQVRLDSDSMVNPTVGGYQCVYWGLFDKCIDWLNKNMFDYRGLIPLGLALEATKGMYKTE